MQFVLDGFHDPFGAIGEFPVRRHGVDAKQFLCADHVTAFRPHRCRRTLPGVAAIQEEAAAMPFGANAFQQGRQVGETADLAVAPGCFRKVQVGKGIGAASACRHMEILEVGVAHEMRRPSPGGSDAKVDVGFAKVHGQKLGMAVGHMQQTDVAVYGHVIEMCGRHRCVFFLQALDATSRQAACGTGHRQHLQKFPSR